MAKITFTVGAEYSKLIELRKQITALEEQIKNLNLDITPKINIQGLEQQLSSLKKQYQDLHEAMSVSMQGNNGIANATPQIDTMTTSVRNLDNSLRFLHDSSSSVAQGVGMFTKQFAASALVLKGIYETIGLIKGAVSTIMDFTAMNAQLQAILGTSEEGIQGFKASAEELGRTTVFTASQVTQLQIELAKLGFQEDAIHSMESAVLGFAQAVGASLPDAAGLAGAAMRMFGMEMDEVGRVTGAMSASIMSSALDFQAIRDNFAQFGPVAHQIGLSIEESLALFGALKNQGYDGSMAATSLRNIMNEMAGGKLQKELGFTVNSFETFNEALLKLGENGMKGAEGVKKAMDSVGKRGGAQLLALVQEAEKGTLTDIYSRIEEGASQATTDKMAETMTNNLTGAIKMMESAWQGLILEFQESDGVMKGVVDTITEMIRSVQLAISGSEEADPLLRGIVSSLQLVGEGIGFVTDVIGEILPLIEALMVSFMAYKGAMLGIELWNSAQAAIAVASMNAQATALARLTTATEENNAMSLTELELNGRISSERANQIRMVIAEAQAELARVQAKRQAVETEMTEVQAEIAQLNASNASATATQRKANIELIASKNTRLKALSEKADALAMREEQIATATLAAEETVATGTTLSLTSAMNALGLSMLANPYVLAIAAVAGLGFAIYELCSKESAQEVATNAAKDAMEDYHNVAEQMRGKMESLASTITSTNATLYDQVAAYQELIEMSDKFKGHSLEELKKMEKENPGTIKKMIYEESLESEYGLFEKRKELLQDYFKTYQDMFNENISESQFLKKIEELNKQLEDYTEKYGEQWAKPFEGLNDAVSGVGSGMEIYYEALKLAIDDCNAALDDMNNKKEQMRLAEADPFYEDFVVPDDVAKEFEDLYKGWMDTVKEYAEYSQALDLDSSNKEYATAMAERFNQIQEYATNVKKKVDDIKKEYANKEMPVNVQFKLREYEKLLTDMENIKTLTDTTSGTYNIDFIVNYAKGTWDSALFDQDKFDKGKKQFSFGNILNDRNIATEDRNLSSYFDLNYIRNRVKTEDDKQEEASGSFNDAEQRRKAEHKYQELLKEIKEKRMEAELDIARSTDEARVKAMAEGEERAREQRRLDHEKEIKQIRDNAKKRLEEYVKQQKRIFEEDPDHKGQSEKKGGKDGKGARGGKSQEFFDEEAFKKSQEYLDMLAKVTEESNAKIMASNRVVFENMVKGYETASDKRKKEVDKIKSDIDGMVEMRNRLDKIMHDIQYVDQDDLDIYSNLLADTSKKFEDYTAKEKDVFLRLKDFSVEEIMSAMNMTYEQVKTLEEEYAKLGEVIQTAQDKIGERDRKSEIDYFSEYGTNEEKRLAIQKKYAMEREKIAEDDTNAILKNKRDEQKALNALEKKIFEDSELYRTTMEDPSNASARAIQTLIEHLNSKLQEGIANGNLTYEEQRDIIEDINNLKEKMLDVNPVIAYQQAVTDLTKAQEELRDLQNDWVDNGNGMMRNVKDGKTMSKQAYDDKVLANYNKQRSAIHRIGEAEKGVEKVSGEVVQGLIGVGNAFADAFGDETGEEIKKITNALSVCWQSFQTMTENIQKFTEATGKTMEATQGAIEKTSEGVEAAAVAGTTALSTMEKASAILAIIAAAVQMITVLSSLVKDSHDIYEKHAEKQKKINDLTDAINDYKLAVIDARNAEKEWFNVSGLEGLRDAGDKAKQVMDNYNAKIAEAQETYRDQTAGWKKYAVPVATGLAAITVGAVTGGIGSAVVTGIASSLSSPALAVAIGATVDGLVGTAIGAIGQNVANRIFYGEGQTSARNNMRMETRSKNFWHGQKTQNLEEWAKENLQLNLFGEDGSLNLEAAQTILEKYGDKLVGQTKETLEYLVECQEEYNEFLDQVKDYTSRMFSPLVDNMTDALWNWLETGQDVLYSFHQSASQTFQAIAKDMIKNLANKHIFDGYQDQLEDLTKAYALGGMSEEDYARKVLELTNTVEDKAEAVMPKLQSAMENIAKTFEDKGYDVVKGGEATAGAKAFGAMSQDIGESMNGRLGAMQIAVEDIRGTIKLFSWDIVTKPLDLIDTHISESVLAISDARDILANTYIEVMAIRENTDNMVGYMKNITPDIEDIKRNTEGLIR